MQLQSIWQLPHKDGAGEIKSTDYRYIMFVQWAFLCGAVSHFALIFYFLTIGLPFMAYVNVVSVSIFLCNIALARRRRIFLASSLAVLEVNGHAALATYFLGWEAGFPYFIFVLPIALFFYPDKRVSFSLSAISIANFALLHFLLGPAAPLHPVSPEIIHLTHLAIAVTTFLLLSIMAFSFSRTVDTMETQMQYQYHRAENLLRNILPAPVAQRLHQKEQPIADGFPAASILFADLENFTEFSGEIKPKNLVQILNDYFSAFDDLLEPYGIEKIKTVGDAYMVAAGLPEETGDHAELITAFALAMLETTRDFNRRHRQAFSLRIGINSGPVVAGVIGKKKFIYDLWGDTVNVAARMEASGVPGQIHITENTYRLIRHKYEANRRAPLHIKGKGLMQTYLLNLDRV